MRIAMDLVRLCICALFVYALHVSSGSYMCIFSERGPAKTKFKLRVSTVLHELFQCAHIRLRSFSDLIREHFSLCLKFRLCMICMMNKTAVFYQQAPIFSYIYI